MAEQAKDKREKAAVPSPFASALRLLARRSYTREQLRLRLERDWDAAAVAQALARLSQLALVDDVAWAQRFAADRFERCGRGRHRILAELAAAGISADVAARAVESVIDTVSERLRAEAQMRSLLGGRAGAGKSPGAGARAGSDRGPAPVPTERERASAYRRLVARGFPASLVRDLLGGS